MEFALVLFDQEAVTFPTGTLPASPGREEILRATRFLATVSGGSGACYRAALEEAFGFAGRSESSQMHLWWIARTPGVVKIEMAEETSFEDLLNAPGLWFSDG